LPKPSVDTGAGLERIAAALQGVTSNYHADAFLPLLRKAEEVIGLAYTGISPEGLGGATPAPGDAGIDPASFRVLADHARAVAFLLADGVFPSNDGRGYVLRRILRRAVRHAWLLGRREPTLVFLVEDVIARMSDVYPELTQRRHHILETTKAEEERFLATIDGGMARFDQLAPAGGSTQGSTHLRGTISGDDAFRLYDTYGFPIDLTELMARERGYSVDLAGFEASLAQQRSQSQAERKSRKLGVGADDFADVAAWRSSGQGDGDSGPGSLPPTNFVGYDVVEIETQVAAVRRLEDDRVAVLLRETPFYAESGGQVSDHGEIVGDGWRVDVTDVRKIEGRTAAIGKATGEITFGRALARVPSDRRRDTERNHTATHLLHAALRAVAGEGVHQAGSVVEPDRLRFDFTHHGPLRPEQLAEIERRVNRGVWASVPVTLEQKAYKDAVAAGAMALFNEKYGDVVRVVSIPGLSVELCGGTHVRNTSEIGLFKIVSETGVAAGVRRIVAHTGPRAFELLADREHGLSLVAERLKMTLPAGTGSDVVAHRLDALLQEKRQLEKRLDEAMRGGGGDAVERLVSGATAIDGMRVVSSIVSVPDVKSLQALGDAIRERLKTGVAALGATFDDGKSTLLAVVTDDVRERGVRADSVIKELAAAAGGRGGGKPHMAQAGIPDAARMPEALGRLPDIVRGLLGAA
jgi:alanyl-tRNA synthetase